MHKLLINTIRPKEAIISPQRIMKTNLEGDPFSPLPIKDKEIPILQTEGELFLYKTYKEEQPLMSEQIAHDIYPDDLQLKTQVLLLSNIDKSQYPILLKRLEQRKQNIDLVQFVMERGEKKKNYHLVIYFKSGLISEEFYNLFMDNYCLFVLYILEVIIMNKQKNSCLEKELLNSMNEFDIIPEAKEGNQSDSKISQQQYIQLPKCLLCLIKLQSSISGLPKRLTSNKQLISSQELCQTCCYLQTNSKELKCYHCESNQDIWICMICSNIGCGRYKNADAYKHFVSSGHIITIELETQRIWNYRSDCFSHRLIPLNKQESTLKFPDYSGKKPNQLYEQAVESAFWEYCSLVSQQLERQRIFYEKEKAREQDRFEKESVLVEKMLLDIDKQLDLKNQQVKKLLKKNKKLNKRLGELKQECNDGRELLASYDKLMSQNIEEMSLEQIEKDSPKIQEKLKILQGLDQEIESTLLKLTE